MIHLMARKALGLTLSEQEESELAAWLEASDENRRIFEQVKTFQDADKMLRLERDGYARQMAKRVMRQLAVSGQRRVRHDWWKWMGGVAAAVAIIVCAVVWSLPEAEELPFARQEGQIVPGKVEAVLTFANGEKLHITDTTSEEVWKERLLVVDSACEGKAFVEEGQAVTYNVLAVPAGGEFFYVLPDSTRVWINSDSELRFPTNFVDGVRRVELRGEAFFDVESNEECPFSIHSGMLDVNVTGTSFNVCAYNDNPMTTVTVKSGKVGVVYGDDDIRMNLRADEEIVINTDDSSVSRNAVNAMDALKWMRGSLIFRQNTLPEVIRILRRHYSCDIELRDSTSSVRISGTHDNKSIESVLESICFSAGLHYRVKDGGYVIY